MKILIAGGTGFIGSALSQRLKQKHDVIILSRRVTTHKNSINWQNLDNLNGYDVVVNLAGANIGEGRWTHKRKHIILNSRITTTSRLANLCAMADEPKPRLINASAIGIYGLQNERSNELPLAFDDDTEVDFNSPPDFLAEVASSWEQATSPAVKAACGVTWLRFGVVLDKTGGALKKILPAFKMGMGGVIGSGNQPFSWISLYDAIRAIEFIIEKNINGPVCLVAPGAVKQRNFAKILANTLHRPCFFNLPAWLILALFGEMGNQLLLRGQHVKPKRLQALKFQFHTSTLKEALEQILK